MPVNDFLPFATGAGANVESQAAYSGDPSTAAGFSAGIAQSQKVNKVWRQSSFISAAVAKFVADMLSVDVLDDGNLPGFVQNFEAAILKLAPRQALLADTTTFYVNPITGNDGYDGSAPTQAFQTIQAAIDKLYTLDVNGNKVVIQLANGTYPGGSVFSGVPVGVFNPRQITVQGNIANPLAVQIIGTDVYGLKAQDGALVTVQGFHVGTTTSADPKHSGVSVANNSVLRFQMLDFGACAWGHIHSSQGSVINGFGPYSISGGGAYHWHCNNAYLRIGFTPSGPITLTINNAPTFTFAFASVANAGHSIIDDNSYVNGGTVIGSTHHVADNATLSTPAADVPGNAAGVPATARTLTATGGLWRILADNVPPGGTEVDPD